MGCNNRRVPLDLRSLKVRSTAFNEAFMIRTMHRYCIALTVVVLSACTVTPRHDASESPASASTAASLASWNDSATKRSIVDFVTLVTTPESKDFIPRADRIAVFDNDGTLWPEQP